MTAAQAADGHDVRVAAGDAEDGAAWPCPVHLVPGLEARTRAEGFAVVKELCGHGVGRAIHEEPQVLNYFDPSQGDVLTDGLVITIEPLLSARPARAVTRRDGWTIATANGALAVHHEHTLIVGREGPEIVTLFQQ